MTKRMVFLFRDLVDEVCESTSEASMEVVDPVNDSLYELHKPTGQSKMNVLFFHGLQYDGSFEPYKTTWLAADGSHLWPRTWLARDFPDARILSVSYDGCLRRSRQCGRFGMHNIGESLVMDLIEQAQIGQKCPVVLVGHGFGGLVMKQLCLEAFKMSTLRDQCKTSSMRQFLANVKGMFFYGTPHRGIPSIKLMETFAFHTSSPLVEFVHVYSEEGARLNFDFDLLYALNKHWRIFSVGEAFPTSLHGGLFHQVIVMVAGCISPRYSCILWLPGLFHQVIVPEASARYGEKFCLLREDHVSLCRPKGTTSNNYCHLKDLLQGIYEIPPKEETRPDNLQQMPEYVGSESLEELKLKLKMAKCVGIVGMGGIGKSTLAKAIFNDVNSDFEYSCFILDVKTIKGGEKMVEEALLQHMYHDGKKVLLNDLEILKGRRLLLILDDVDDVDDDVDSERELRVMQTLRERFGVREESRFILTSRNRKLFTSLEDVYELPVLGQESSRLLFVHYAFRKEEVLPSFKTCIDEILLKCGGLPLALEVLGKYLYKESLDVWKQTVQALKLDDLDPIKYVEKKLHKILKVSYNNLPELGKQMFIQAATSFHGCLLSEAKRAWSATTKETEHLRWKHLVDMSLVQEHVDWFGKCCIRVHEQLRSLAWSIVSHCGEWGSIVHGERTSMYKDVEWEQFWAEPRGEVVALRLQKWDKEVLVASRFEPWIDHWITDGRFNLAAALPNLQLLELSDDIFQKIDMIILPTSLVYLQLGYCPGSHLQVDLTSLSRLAVLKLHSHHHLVALPEYVGRLSSLKALWLSSLQSLTSLPDNFGGLPKLQELDLYECLKLKTLPETFGDLVELTDLSIRRCGLRSLPHSIGRLEKLQYLIIENAGPLPGNVGLNSLLDSTASRTQQLQKLQYLQIWFAGLDSLPDSFGDLPNLQDVDLYGGIFVTLPDTFGNLKQLTRLKFRSCHLLWSLPDSFGKLEKLEYLKIVDCPVLSSLPDSFGKLEKLEYLEIERCHRIETLPGTFGKLSSLKSLELHKSEAFQALPDSFGNLPRLTKLTISECDYLWTLPPSFARLVALEQLIINYTALESIPDDIVELRCLKSLELKWKPSRKPLTLGRSLSKVVGMKTVARIVWWTFSVVDGHFVMVNRIGG